jgi:hypothetical protein
MTTILIWFDFCDVYAWIQTSGHQSGNEGVGRGFGRFALSFLGDALLYLASRYALCQPTLLTCFVYPVFGSLEDAFPGVSEFGIKRAVAYP